MTMRTLLCIVLLAVLSCLAAFPARAGGVLRLAVTDLQGLDAVRRDFGPLATELGRLLGDGVEFLPVFGRVEAVEALRRREVDLVLTGPAEYVVFRKLTRAAPVAGFLRPGYHSVVAVLAGGGMADAGALRGGKVALGSVGSTSRHLGPMQVLASGGLDPLKDVKVVHMDMDAAWEALKHGSVDAVGMSGADFESRSHADADLPPEAFRVLGSGPDLPNDVLMAGAHLDAATVETLRGVFAEHGPQLKAALLRGPGNGKYAGMEFLSRVRDEDYDIIRRMYGLAGFPAYSEFLGR